MMHAYRINLLYHIWSLTDPDACVTIRAFSAEDALTIVRIRLRQHGYQDDHMIQDIHCEEDK